MNINSILDKVERQLNSNYIQDYEVKVNDDKLSSDLRFIYNTKLKYMNNSNNELDSIRDYRHLNRSQNNINTEDAQQQDLSLVIDINQHDQRYLLKDSKKNTNKNFYNPKLSLDQQLSESKIEHQVHKIIEREMQPYLYSAKNEFKNLIDNLTSSVGDFQFLKNEFEDAKESLIEHKRVIDSFKAEADKRISQSLINSHVQSKSLDDLKLECRYMTDKIENLEKGQLLTEEKLLYLAEGVKHNNCSEHHGKINISKEVDAVYSGRFKFLENQVSVLQETILTMQNEMATNRIVDNMRKEMQKIYSDLNLQETSNSMRQKRLEGEIDRLKNQNESINQEVQVLKVCLESRDNAIEIDDIQSKVKLDLEEALTKISNEITSVKFNSKSACSSLSKDFSALKEEINALRVNTNKCDQELNSKIIETSKQHESLEKENKTMLEIFNKIYEEIETLKKKNAEIKKEIKINSDKVASDMVTRTEELAKSIRIVENNRSESNKRAQELSKNIYTKVNDRIDEAFEIINKQLKEMKTPIDDYISERPLVNDIIFKLKSEIDGLKHDLKNTEQTTSKGVVQVNSGGEDLNIIKEKIELINSELSLLKEDKVEMNEKISKLHMSIKKLSGDIGTIHQILVEFTNNLDTIKEQQKKTEAANKSEIDSLTKTIEDFRSKLESSIKKVKSHMKEEFKSIKNDVAEMQSALSNKSEVVNKHHGKRHLVPMKVDSSKNLDQVSIDAAPTSTKDENKIGIQYNQLATSKDKKLAVTQSQDSLKNISNYKAKEKKSVHAEWSDSDNN